MRHALWVGLMGLALGTATEAHAGRCDTYVRASATAKGEALVEAYKRLVTCDVEAARVELPRFLLAAGDLETLVPLALAGVRADAHTQIWDVMQRVPYEHRTELASQVGAACGTEPKVLPFLQGAYVGQKGAAFTSWTPALTSCASEPLVAWLEAVIVDPPSGPYNEKYNAILSAYTDIRRAASLPKLVEAAKLVGTRGGPFNNLLEAMQGAVQPASYRDTIKPEDQKALEDALVEVGKGSSPESARLVSDRIYSAGNEALAASLLPAVYPDRVQAGGTFLWAAAATEACDGEAAVHWVSWTEAPKRLAITEAATAPLRALKPKLKCSAEGPWPVVATPEPFANTADVAAWVAERVAEAEAAGFKAKDREEKKVVVP